MFWSHTGESMAFVPESSERVARTGPPKVSSGASQSSSLGLSLVTGWVPEKDMEASSSDLWNVLMLGCSQELCPGGPYRVHLPWELGALVEASRRGPLDSAPGNI